MRTRTSFRMGQVIKCQGARTRNTGVWLASLLIVAGSAQLALAIGPANQTISPQDNSVVRLLDGSATGNAAGANFDGTGSIIDNMDINGQGWFCVLTADHVVSSTGAQGGALANSVGIAFGNSANNNGSSAYLVANQSKIFRGGVGGLEDLAVVGVPYGAFNPAFNSYAISLQVAGSPTNQLFSDIGFGNQGNLTPTGYQAQGLYGTQRFLNDAIDTITPVQAQPGGYTYAAALWTIDNPNGAGAHIGSGSAFDADSGSPYFAISNGASALVTNLVFQNTTNNTTVFYNTDGEFAVHTFGSGTTNMPPSTIANQTFKAFGNTNGGVALFQPEINWIETECALVPEPSSVTLVIFGMAGLFLARRRARAGVKH